MPPKFPKNTKMLAETPQIAKQLAGPTAQGVLYPQYTSLVPRFMVAKGGVYLPFIPSAGEPRRPIRQSWPLGAIFGAFLSHVVSNLFCWSHFWSTLSASGVAFGRPRAKSDPPDPKNQKYRIWLYRFSLNSCVLPRTSKNKPQDTTSYPRRLQK